MQYTASAAASTTEDYRCDKCDYAGVGHASAVESATMARGGAVFGNDRAAEMARDEAQARAWQEVLSDVPMAPCPRCGSVNRSAWIGWLTSGRIGTKLGVGTVLLICALTWLGVSVAMASGGSTLMSIGVRAVVAIVAWLVLVIYTVGSKRASSRRVRFEPPR